MIFFECLSNLLTNKANTFINKIRNTEKNEGQIYNFKNYLELYKKYKLNEYLGLR